MEKQIGNTVTSPFNYLVQKEIGVLVRNSFTPQGEDFCSVTIVEHPYGTIRRWDVDPAQVEDKVKEVCAEWGIDYVVRVVGTGRDERFNEADNGKALWKPKLGKKL